MSAHRWMQIALRAYPRAWRERYEREVLDLGLELRDARAVGERRTAFGLLVHAPRAWHLHRQTSGRRQYLMGSFVVLAGVVAAVAGLLVPASAAASSTIRVVSNAMAPALKRNEVVQVSRLSASTRLEPGQIVVFRYPTILRCEGYPAKYLVKRIIGLPDQTISLSGADVLINGQKLKEPWLAASEQHVTFPGPTGTPFSLHHPYRIPADSYYVLGDNRTDSCDSRYLGTVPRSLVYGVVTSSH
jgi:signal peptidase I